MTKTYTKQTRRFKARKPNGSPVDVFEYIDFTEIETLDGKNAISKGLPEYRLADGSPVNRIDKAHYQIVWPECELTTDDPNAP